MSQSKDAYTALVDAIVAAGAVVSGTERGSVDDFEQAAGYHYSTELLRVALDLYGDTDEDVPQFVPFGSHALGYHAGGVIAGRIQGGINPDAVYDQAILSADRSYRITGRRGSDVYMSFSFSGGRNGHRPDRTMATVNDTQLDFGRNGEFELIVSPEEPTNAPNATWVRSEADLCSVIVRQYFNRDPRLESLASLTIEALDDRPPRFATHDERTAARLRAAAAFIDATIASFPSSRVPAPNTVNPPLGYTGEAGALGTTDNVYASGAWLLDEDDALVVELRPPLCRYWSVQLWNRWGQSVTSDVMPEDDAYNRIILNNSHAVMQPDGCCRIVIAHRDPGTPNWLNPFGHRQGVVFFRWLMPEHAPEPPTASLTKLSPSVSMRSS
ncbi:MAG TPA: DUF1214 domain-containing protein [Acidimicrobiales bacterium]|nr:DUF1214 domain-containing protein [Acidimicrobiales bacterium]